MLDQLRGGSWLDANAGVGEDGAVTTANKISAGEARLVAGDFDVSRRGATVQGPRHIVDHGSVTETEIISYVGGQSGVVTLTASEENSAPEAAWGDTFCYYDPEGNRPENQATIVTHDYAGWDTESHLDRQGIFRVNIAVGRSGFEQLLGYPPAQHEAHHNDFDYGATDVLIPHPIYASQGWVSILNPGERTSAQLKLLLDNAHRLAVERHLRRQATR